MIIHYDFYYFFWKKKKSCLFKVEFAFSKTPKLGKCSHYHSQSVEQFFDCSTPKPCAINSSPILKNPLICFLSRGSSLVIKWSSIEKIESRNPQIFNSILWNIHLEYSFEYSFRMRFENTFCQLKQLTSCLKIVVEKLV